MFFVYFVDRKPGVYNDIISNLNVFQQEETGFSPDPVNIDGRYLILYLNNLRWNCKTHRYHSYGYMFLESGISLKYDKLSAANLLKICLNFRFNMGSYRFQFGNHHLNQTT